MNQTASPIKIGTFAHARMQLNAELKQWYRKQACEPFTRFYCYYLPTNLPMRTVDSTHIVISKERPGADYKLVQHEPVNGMTTVHNNYMALCDALRRCAILTPQPSI